MSFGMFLRILAPNLSRNYNKFNNAEAFSSRPGHLCQSTSSTSKTAQEVATDGNNVLLNESDEVNPNFVNRNPRNLEKLCVAHKPRGYALEYPSRTFWHKVVLEQSNRNTSGYILHFSGKKVVTASTTEWSIKKFLYSSTDVSAASNIGIILGQRCLESGILHASTIFSQHELNSETVKAFLDGLEEGGLSLEEPRRIFPLRPWD